MSKARGADSKSGARAKRGADGYRRTPVSGCTIRADVIDVYVIRAGAAKKRSRGGDFELLQLKRAKEPLMGTWQPVMGHIEPGETAVEAAMREMHEEVGLTASSGELEGFFALEQVHPYYIAAIDCVVLSPRFVALVGRDWRPRLNREHSAARWVKARDAAKKFMWPGQRAAIGEIAGVM